MYTFPEDLKRIYESIPLSFVYYQNIDGRAIPVLASERFCRIVGKKQEEVLSWLRRGMFERMHPDDVGVLSRVSNDFINQRGEYDVIFRCRLGEEYQMIHGIGGWQTMPDGTMLAVIGYVNLTTTQGSLLEKMEEYGLFQQDQFYTDALTGLPNINYLHKYGEEKIGVIKAEGDTPVVVYTDVFSMQSYNNNYGFEAGNNLLKLIADTFRKEFPKALVTRGADDHFVMLLGENYLARLQARLVLIEQKIRREAYGNTSGLRSGICPVDVNLGISIDHARHALKRIDTNINEISRIFSQEADEVYWRDRYIVESIDRAIEEGWISVFYQGIIRIKTGKVSAFEALARWIDPHRGMITPGEFIPALQKYHQLYKLDLYMFEQVCREIPIRQEHGLPLLPVSINISRQDFDYVDMVEKMNELCERYVISQYVDKSYFIIEITEQEIAANPEQCRIQMRRIKESGYRLWLDDFGSGYSSFNMFSQFQFDLIKYDMEMIRHLDDNNGANRLILKELVRLAKGLKLHTLIEGIETEEHLAFVKEIGCELAQGFLFHKPTSLDEILFHQKERSTGMLYETPEERQALNREWFDQADE